MGDDVKCQASGDETAGAVGIRIWCTNTLVNLLWKPSMSSFPKDGEKIKEKKLIFKSRVDLSRLPRTSLLWSPTSSMGTTGLLRASTRSSRGGWRLTWESWNHCDHVVLSCQPHWLISWMLVIRKEMTRLIMKNTSLFDESGEWWVNGGTGPFRIILSVLTVLLQVQHALAYILHITYSADWAQRRTNP